jgi:sulfoxide reductase heme-binding subunit YedZ
VYFSGGLSGVADHLPPRFVLITLAMTPIRQIFGWNGAVRFRRMLGLFAFFYGFLHFVTYLWFNVFFDFGKIVEDVAKRPFITVGFAGFVLMIPLAITSTKKWITRLGGKRWQFLHKAIYITGILGVIHYIWRLKTDIKNPLIYAFLLALLLGYRLWHKFRPVSVVR